MRGWLPDGFEPPESTTVPFGHRLRRVRTVDARRLQVAVPGLDLPAAERLLQTRLDEMARRAAYTFALVDTDETALLGEVRVAPGRTPDIEAEVVWWMVPECRGTDLSRAVDALMPAWVADHWPLTAPQLGPVLALPRGEC
jgi:hypothetical protein